MAKIPKAEYKTEIEIKKSRFIGMGFLINNVDEARVFLKKIKNDYPDSKHVCYGFLWGKNSTHMGMSDDGEPNGTAGRPIIEVLKGSGIENILVAVVRYFGGIKLGTGGLVKAYTEISKLVVENIPTEEYIERENKSLILPYTLYNQVKIVLETFNAEIINEEFLTDIKIDFKAAASNIEEISYEIKNISSGLLTLY
ncbi:MAG: YigZ family protein [Spirochaetales bacterium]|nr:YigZ family protein [Spirochaetales bacterium]